MRQVVEHDWGLGAEDAEALQEELSRRVVRTSAFGRVKLVAGVDVAYAKDGDGLAGAAIVLDAETLEIVETSTCIGRVDFLYAPGLFSFRELPVIVEALRKLERIPDLILCDGQGIAHARRFGLASHLGVLFEIPSIGCAKTRLVGTHGEPAPARGSTADLIDQGEIVGAALRTQSGVRPVYVSVGHRISLADAVEWVLRLSLRYRLSEPIRAADQAARAALRSGAD